jgi:hypothetical protein
MVNEAGRLVLVGLLSILPLLTVAVGLGWFLRWRMIRLSWWQLLALWLGMTVVGYGIVLGMMLLG